MLQLIHAFTYSLEKIIQIFAGKTIFAALRKQYVNARLNWNLHLNCAWVIDS